MNGNSAPAARLSALGTALYARYQHTGDSDDLDRAVDVLQKAVAATPAATPTGPPTFSTWGSP